VPQVSTAPRIHVFPNWRTNPYLTMVYVGAQAEGWQVEGTTKPPQLVRAISDLGGGDVLHLHWTGPIVQSEHEADAARRNLDAFTDATDAALARGTRLIWTVHNQLPHRTRHFDLELELNRYLADRAWRVIQLNPFTRQAVADLFELPAERTVTLRHASYLGVYPDPPDEATARAAIGAPPSGPTIGFVGQVRAYKGINTLLAAADLVDVDGLTLLLAGRTGAGELAAVEQNLPRRARTLRHHAFLDDAALANWVVAADLLVFPYERILNSGSVLLAATFGRPCVLPGEPHLLAQYGDQEWITFYEPGPEPTAALARAITDALPTARARRAAAISFAREYATYDMAWDYLRILTADDPPQEEPAATGTVSVVVASHNDAAVIDETLRSLRASVGVDLEVVVVDEASGDDTARLVAAHAAADPRIRLVPATGTGVASARARGVEAAEGQVLAFVSPGDFVPPRGLAALVDALGRDGADLALGDYLRVGSNWTDRLSHPLDASRGTTTLVTTPSLAEHRGLGALVTTRGLWEQLASLPGATDTDLSTVTAALASAGRIAVVPTVAYAARVRQDSDAGGPPLRDALAAVEATADLVDPGLRGELVGRLVLPLLTDAPPPEVADRLLRLAHGLNVPADPDPASTSHRVAAVLRAGTAADLAEVFAGASPVAVRVRSGIGSASAEGTHERTGDERLLAVPAAGASSPVELGRLSPGRGVWRLPLKPATLKPGSWQLVLETADPWGVRRVPAKVSVAAPAPLRPLSRFAAGSEGRLVVRRRLGRRVAAAARRLVRRR